MFRIDAPKSLSIYKVKLLHCVKCASQLMATHKCVWRYLFALHVSLTLLDMRKTPQLLCLHTDGLV